MGTIPNNVPADRRRFLQSLSVAGLSLVAAPLIGPSRVSRGSLAPSDRLRVAAIGTGGRCCALMEEVLRQGDEIVALCDVDQSQIARARSQIAAKVDGGGPAMDRVQVYDDYRKLFEAEQSFDAALIATGSRWHAPLTVPLMKAGKHVYCEKPLVRKIAEARELIELTPQCKVATQHGTQGGSGSAFRRSVEIIQAGLLGQVREVYLWCDGYGTNAPSHSRPAGEDPVPPGLNWDFWLGPAELRPFKRGVYHPGCITFQNWLDLCNGMLAGQGAHTFYLPVVALRLPPPLRVTAEILEPVLETYVSKGCFHFEYAARDGLEPVKLWWSDGGRYPPEEVTESVKAVSGKVPNMGCLFVGQRGQLFAGGWGEAGILRLQGDAQWRGVLDHEAAKSLPLTLPRAPDDNHMAEWLRACKGGPATFTSFDVGARVSEAYLPGILALRLGRPIEWDAAKLQVKDCPEADPLIQKSYRTRWMA